MVTKRLQSVIDLAAGIAMFMASVVLIWSVLGRPSSHPDGIDGPPVPSTPVSLQGAWVRGSKDAPLVILVYSDFECPYSRAFGRETLPALQRDYVDTGKIQLAFRHLPLTTIHPNARRVAEAAACAGNQAKFWEMHDRLFRAQQEFEGGVLLAHASAIGLDVAGFERCMSQGSARTRIDADASTAADLRISTTPTFLVGRLRPDGRLAVAEVLRGLRPYSAFVEVLERVAKKPHD